MSASIRKRQENELVELRRILAGGHHDDGRPMSEEAKAELRQDLARLEKAMGR